MGCGNLLSFSFFSAAGVMMCDGLEWCRTFAASNFHLHHFQHRDVFYGSAFYGNNPAVEYLVSKDVRYETSAAGLNLLSFQIFTNELQKRLAIGTVDEFIATHFGNNAGAAVRSLTP
jgi:hypothetical protein